MDGEGDVHVGLRAAVVRHAVLLPGNSWRRATVEQTFREISTGLASVGQSRQFLLNISCCDFLYRCCLTQQSGNFNLISIEKDKKERDDMKCGFSGGQKNGLVEVILMILH